MLMLINVNVILISVCRCLTGMAEKARGGATRLARLVDNGVKSLPDEVSSFLFIH